MAVFFSKVSAGLAQISETPRFRDRDKTETLAIRDQDLGSETRDLQKMVLRPRPRPRPGLETTTLVGTYSSTEFRLRLKELAHAAPLSNSHWFEQKGHGHRS